MITIAQARVAKSSGAKVSVNGDAATVTDIYTEQEGEHGWALGIELKGWTATLEPQHVKPGPALLELMTNGTYDANGYRSDEKSPEQTRIYEQAEDLIELLRQVVPDNVAHWAVEEARRALRDLAREAGKIHTHDTRVMV